MSIIAFIAAMGTCEAIDRVWPAGAVLGLDMGDPRLDRVASEHSTHNVANSTASACGKRRHVRWPEPNTEGSSIWTHKGAARAFEGPATHAGTDRTDQGMRGEPATSDVPVLLSRISGLPGVERATFRGEPLAEWTLVLPRSAAKFLWVRLVKAGARAIGLREREEIATEMGRPTFPRDYPDTTAGHAYWCEKVHAQHIRNKARPPAKRVAIALPGWTGLAGVGLADGGDDNHSSPYGGGGGGGGGTLASPSSFVVIRNTAFIQPFLPQRARNACAGGLGGALRATHSIDGPVMGELCAPLASMPHTALSVVILRSTGRGIPAAGAEIVAASPEHARAWSSAAAAAPWSGIQLSSSGAVTVTHATGPCTLLGWVSAGGSALLRHGGRALGLCEASRLHQVLQEAHTARQKQLQEHPDQRPPRAVSARLVLYRNPGSTWLRPALIFIGT